MQTDTLQIELQAEQDTIEFANALAPVLNPGDTLLLDGPIGAGKSTFARALIQARLGRKEDVPSPTFTLVQTYEDQSGDLWHCDLYRLTHPDEAFELGLDEAFLTGICLIEWPDRLGDAAPKDALCLHFLAHDDQHSVRLHFPEKWAARLSGLLPINP